MKYIIITVILILSNMLRAQDTLCGQHHGAMQRSGKFYVELVNCGDDVEVFVYNLLKNPVSPSIITNAEIEYAYLDETFWTVALVPGTSGNLQAKVPDKNFYKARVSFQIGNSSVTVYFENEFLLITTKPGNKN